MKEILFNIKNWSAFAPELENQQDWQDWAKGLKFVSSDHSLTPKVDFIPAMSRRRLSQLTKMSLQTAFDCAGNLNHNIESVFASRYGEWQQTVKLLKNITEKEEISPAGFSLSVHNSAAGIYSITNKNKSAYTAISANEFTFQAALIEALGRLQSQENILLIVGEEAIPDFYNSIYPQDFFPYTTAFLLSKKNPEIKLNFTAQAGDKPIDALQFLKWLILKNPTQKLESSLFDLEFMQKS